MSRDESRQDETFSASQEAALSSLLAGRSVTDAAADAKVSRSTLHRWLTDEVFEAALNLRRDELRKSCRSRLFALAEKSVSCLEAAAAEDPKIALAVVRDLGLLEKPVIGHTDPERLRASRKESEWFKGLALGL